MGCDVMHEGPYSMHAVFTNIVVSKFSFVDRHGKFKLLLRYRLKASNHFISYIDLQLSYYTIATLNIYDFDYYIVIQTFMILSDYYFITTEFITCF